MQDFKVVRNEIADIEQILEEIQATLDETYEKAMEVHGSIKDSGNWSGESQKVGLAFLDLTTQYHAMLAGTKNRPVEQAYEALKTFLETEGEFYDTWESYQKLLQI